MIIELFGVRGSLPSPTSREEHQYKITKILENAIESGLNSKDDIKDFIKELPLYLKTNIGGNTTCISVTSKSGMINIIDCGTGIRTLGDRLIKDKKYLGNGEVNIFITHTHWDHIQGLPFFKPIYIPGNKLNFYSTFDDLEERFSYQQDLRFFPKRFVEMPSTKTFNVMSKGNKITLDDGITVECYPLNHPGTSFAYKFTEDGKSFIFATDAEITGNYLEKTDLDNSHFFENSDLLIADSQYTLDEAFEKFDWGHTSHTMIVNCSQRWGIKKLGLTHHDPANNDKKLFEIYQDSIEHRKLLGVNHPEIFLAVEGLKVIL